jgi:RNA polymerase sigma-70 factor (ECF subfamily)
MDNFTDIELVRLAQDGDPDAFEHLVQRHYMLVYKVSYKWCGVREDAEDIAQEVFVKLAGKLKSFKQNSSFSTWLYRVTINAAKDFFRKNAAKQANEAAFAEEQKLHSLNPGPAEGPSAPALYAVISRLPVKMKEAVLLVLAEGLSHREAARVLECAETTVSWRIFQARKKLRKSLECEV